MRKISGIASLLSVFAIILFLFAGCGGSGGSSYPGESIENSSMISVKLQMVDASGSINAAAIPPGATGRVAVRAEGLKYKKTITREGTYQAGSLTFDNQIPVHDDYLVKATAFLKYHDNDTFEIIWEGAYEVYVYSNEELKTRTWANQAAISLAFQKIRYIPLYPAKIEFDPPAPVSVISPGTIIPAFKTNVFDQCGNILGAYNGAVNISLVVGAFKDTAAASKSAARGVAVFEGLSVSNAVPSASGFVRLKAEASGGAGLSEPIKAVGVIVPNASIAGYASDTASSGTLPVSIERSPSKFPLGGASISITVDNVEYKTTSDPSGFWKIDVRVNSAFTPAVIKITDSSGRTYYSSTGLAAGKIYIANIKVDPATGSSFIRKAEMPSQFSEAMESSKLKTMIDEEIIRRKTAAAGATRIGGRVTGPSGAAISGALVSIAAAGVSTETDGNGFFSFDGKNFTEGTYILSISRQGFITRNFSLVITADDYGFGVDGVIVGITERQNTAPFVSLVTVSGETNEAAVSYSLDDSENDPCSIRFSYSIDGGANFIDSTSVSGQLSAVDPGAGRSFGWLSLNDIKTNQSNVKVRIIADDGRSLSSPAYSQPFTLNNAPADLQNKLPAVINVLAEGTSENIIVRYRLNDQNLNDICSAELFYSIDGGSAFSRATTVSGDTSSLAPNADYTMNWLSSDDFRDNQNSVRLKVVPNDGKAYGKPGETKLFPVYNDKSLNFPTISNITISGSAEVIMISYDLVNKNNIPATVEVFYSTDSGVNYIKTLNIAGDSRGVPAGSGKSIAWNSFLDFKQNADLCKIKLVASDIMGYGIGVESASFALKNSRNNPPAVRNMTVSGANRDISITYDLFDPQSDLCTVEVLYSIDGGNIFRGTSNIGGETVSVAVGTAKKLIWRSFADFRTLQPEVFLKLFVTDKAGAGTEAVAILQNIDNRPVKSSVSGIETFGSAGDIDIVFNYRNPDNLPGTVEVSYSLDNGLTFIKTLNTSKPDTASVDLIKRAIKWLSYLDFKSNQPGVVIKLTPVDAAGAGTESVSLPMFIRNDTARPRISNMTSSVNPLKTGEVNIIYDLADADNSKCSVEVGFSPGAGLDFIMPADVSGDTFEVTPGQGRRIVWNSLLSVRRNIADARIKLTAYDINGPGTSSVSLPFALNNNAVPVVNNAAASGTSGNITINYTLSDGDLDRCTVEVFYSVNGGASFIKTTNIVNGALATTDLLPGPKTLFWNSSADLPNMNQPNVRIRLRPIDQAGPGIAGDSQSFNVNNLVIIPTTLQSAAFVSSKKMKLTFNANVTGTADVSKIAVSGVVFSGSDYSVQLNNTNTAIITYNTGTFMPSTYIFGLTASQGLTIAAGIGINGPNGEIQPVASSVAIGPDKEVAAPSASQLSKLSYSAARTNVTAAGQLDIGDSYPESAKLLVYIGTNNPNNPGVLSTGTESVQVTTHNSGEVIISGLPAGNPGDGVWYAFTDIAANVSTWAQDGVVPSLPDKNNIYWRNSVNSIRLNGNVSIDTGSRIFVYDYDNSTVYSNIGSSSPLSGPVLSSGSQFPIGSGIVANHNAVYTMFNQAQNESSYADDGSVPAAPAAAPFDNVKLKYNGNNYGIYYNTTGSGSLTYDLRIYKSYGTDPVVIGRARSGSSYNNASFFTGGPTFDAAESKTGESLKDDNPQGGTLKFSYVNASSGNESAMFTPAANAVSPAPGVNYLEWNNESVNSTFTVLNGVPGGAIGAASDTMTAYIKDGSNNYTSAGTSVAAAGGFTPGTHTVNGAVINNTFTVAYTLSNAAGNESPRVDDGAVPMPPSVVDLKVVYDQNGNYKIKNTGAGNFSMPYVTKVFINGVTCGNINASGILTGGGGLSTQNINALSAGGLLQFRAFDPATGNSSQPAGTWMVPAIADMSGSGLANNGEIKVGGTAITSSSSSTIIRLYISDDASGTNRNFYRQTANAVHNAGASFMLIDDIAGGAQGWSPVPAGKVLAYTIFDSTSGNCSALALDGMVPRAPSTGDLSNLYYSNALNEVRASGVVGNVAAGTVEADLKLRLFEVTAGPAYTLRGSTGGVNGGTGFTPGVLMGSVPAFAVSSGVSYIYTNGNENESGFASDGTIPAVPLADNLKTKYDAIGLYKLYNPNAPVNIAAGTALKVFIGNSLCATKTGPDTIPNTGPALSSFSLNDSIAAAGGQLKFTLTESTGGNESAYCNPGVPVPEAPSDTNSVSINTLRVGYDDSGDGKYKIFTGTAAAYTTSASYDTRVYAGNERIGRIGTGVTINGSGVFCNTYLTVAGESPDATRLFELASSDEVYLRFTHVHVALGCESARLSGWSIIPERPSFTPTSAGKTLDIDDVAIRYDSGSFKTHILNAINLDDTIFNTGKISVYDGQTHKGLINLNASGDAASGFAGFAYTAYTVATVPRYAVIGASGNYSPKSIPDGIVKTLAGVTASNGGTPSILDVGDSITLLFPPNINVLSPAGPSDFTPGSGFNLGSTPAYPGPASGVNSITIFVGGSAPSLSGTQTDNNINITTFNNRFVDSVGGNVLVPAGNNQPVAGFTNSDF